MITYCGLTRVVRASVVTNNPPLSCHYPASLMRDSAPALSLAPLSATWPAVMSSPSGLRSIALTHRNPTLGEASVPSLAPTAPMFWLTSLPPSFICVHTPWP